MKESKKGLLLLVGGVAWIAATQIIHHHYTLADSTYGLMTGVGTGLMLIALLKQRRLSR